MTVAVAPSSPPTIGNELRLCRSALLYADTVNLISPHVALLQTMAGYRHARDIDYLRIAAKAAPVYVPEAPEAVAKLQQIVANIDQTSRADRRAQRRELQQIFAAARPIKERLIANATTTLETIGYEELEPALDAGFLTIEAMDSIDIADFAASADDAVVPFEYIGRVQRTLLTGDSYPLFDQVTNEIVRTGIEAGIFAPVPVARRRGRNAALADGFFDQLPHFEHATIDEILDIRTDLRRPLGTFRAGVHRIADGIATAPEDPQFPYEIEDAWSREVAPALDEIEELIAQNTSYREFFQRAITDPAALTGLGGLTGMLMAAGPASGLPAAAAAMITGAAASAGVPIAATKAWIAQWKDHQATSNMQFYFLYATNSRLARPAE